MSKQPLEALLVNPEYTHKIFDLRDGRRLSYSECGNLTTGLPVLFQFGLMASSLAVMMMHNESIKLGLHMIAVDYPGIGESTPVPNRTLEGWAIDMNEFCEKVIGPSNIAVMAHSMGAPHALALLNHAPLSARIRCVTLVAPWLVIDNSKVIPWFLGVARKLPTVFQDSIIPSFATTMTTSSLSSLVLRLWARRMPKCLLSEKSLAIASYKVKTETNKWFDWRWKSRKSFLPLLMLLHLYFAA
jgi:pimeloyl-ACP methyl ester carboxylesterase